MLAIFYYIHCVRLVPPAPALQYFSLTSLQLQPLTTGQLTVFFSHTTPAPDSSSSLPNAVNASSSQMPLSSIPHLVISLKASGPVLVASACLYMDETLSSFE